MRKAKDDLERSPDEVIVGLCMRDQERTRNPRGSRLKDYLDLVVMMEREALDEPV